MLHHLSLAVVNLERSSTFYDTALSSLGYVRVWTTHNAIGYGLPGEDDKFAIKLKPKEIAVPGDGFHVAFSAPSREAVAEFYKQAISHGGVDNGGVGIHPEYGDNYYAAFVIDPDGYRMEAVINGRA